MPFSKENGKDYSLLSRGNIKQLQRVTMMAFISTACLVGVQRNVLSVSFRVRVYTQSVTSCTHTWSCRKNALWKTNKCMTKSFLFCILYIFIYVYKMTKSFLERMKTLAIIRFLRFVVVFNYIFFMQYIFTIFFSLPQLLPRVLYFFFLILVRHSVAYR